MTGAIIDRVLYHCHLLLSPGSYLSVLFKKETGETISEYRSRIRLERAKELLKDTKNRIYEISEKCGYKTASYFTHQFKMVFGCTPNEFRERRL